MRRLKSWHVCAIDDGLTEAEFARVERDFGFEFADDHHAFLATGLPTNSVPELREPGVIYTHAEPWPDWRTGDPVTLREFLDWPVKGVLFDVEHNGFWHETWGSRPDSSGRAIEVARSTLAATPTMVPVYGHRYLPAGRGSFGHPVLSMWQTDIIYYGLDLADYIDREFGTSRRKATGSGSFRATVEFWRDLL
jgi:hypothetical protein